MMLHGYGKCHQRPVRNNWATHAIPKAVVAFESYHLRLTVSVQVGYGTSIPSYGMMFPWKNMKKLIYKFGHLLLALPDPIMSPVTFSAICRRSKGYTFVCHTLANNVRVPWAANESQTESNHPSSLGQKKDSKINVETQRMDMTSLLVYWNWETDPFVQLHPMILVQNDVTNGGWRH